MTMTERDRPEHRRRSGPIRSPTLPGRRRQAAAADGALGLFREIGLSARTDRQCRRRLRAAALRSHRRAGAAWRRSKAAHHAHARRRQAATHGRGQRHRHEPRRDGGGARHHCPLRHQGVPRSHRGGAERRGDGADRPVRRRLLFGVHGGRTRRGDFAPRRYRRGLRLVLGRQGHVCRVAGRGRRMRRSAAPASCCI